MHTKTLRIRAALLPLMMFLACGPLPEGPAEAELHPEAQGLATATGAMARTRAAPVGVRLADGRALVAGGYSSTGGGYLAACELYDVASGTWAPTGSLLGAREYHSLTLLADGRVLAAGGSSSSSASLATAELYDAASGTWSSTGALLEARRQHASVRLADGRVLVAGGFGLASASTPLLTAEVYDPASGTWSATGALLARVTQLALLSDGRVLGVAEGVTSQLYSPESNTWSDAGALPAGQGTQSVVTLADGRVLVAAGSGSGITPRQASLYNPATGTWSLTGSLAQGRYDSRTVLLEDGTVLILGGRDGSTGTVLTTVERYNPAAGTWSAESALLEPRATPGVVRLEGQRLLVFGGRNNATGTWVQLASSELYDAAAMDLAPPSVAIVSPESGTLVGATVSITVSAEDAVGVSKVELYRGTTLMGTADGPGPHTFAWDTASHAYGTYTFTARAYDAAGNVGTSAEVHYTLLNPYATYDAALQAPRCPVTAHCDSGSTLNGRAHLGPEPHQPNTLVGSACADATSGTYHSDESLDTLRLYTLDGSVLAPGKRVRLEATVYASASIGRLELFSAPDAHAPGWTWLATLTTSGSAGSQVLSTEFTLPSGSLQALRGHFYPSSFESPPTPCQTQGFYDDHDDLVFGVQEGPDVTAPTTAITAPAQGATVLGPVTVSASASDAIGVTKVELYVDGVLLATKLGAPYSATWDPAGATEGTHTLTSKAYDAAGNVGTSAPLSVTYVHDVTAPTVSITSPASGATVSGTLLIEASASDERGVKSVEFYAGSRWLGTSYSPPYSSYWDSESDANGALTLSVTARDEAGNASTATVQVTVANDKTAPSVSISSPAAGATLSGTVTLKVSASDDVGVTKVEYFAGTKLLGTSTTAPFELAWDTRTVADGSHSLTARAWDAKGHSSTSTAVGVTVKNAAGTTATYDSTYKAPRCTTAGASCDSGKLLDGRAGLGPESHAPNTLYNSCADGTYGTYHSDESLDRLRISTTDGSMLAPGKTVRIEAHVWVWGASSDRLDLYSTPNVSSPSWTYIGTLAPTASGAQTLSTTYVLPSGAVQAIRGVFRYGGSAGSCVSGPYNDHDDLVFATQ